MAYEEAVRSITLKADASVAEYTGVPGLPGSASPNGGKQYRFVKITGAATCGLATGVANEIVIGVTQNKPQVTGQATTVAIRGVVLVEAGSGGLTAGEAVKCDTDGKGVAWATGTDPIYGVAVQDGAAGKLVPVLLRVNG